MIYISMDRYSKMADYICGCGKAIVFLNEQIYDRGGVVYCWNCHKIAPPIGMFLRNKTYRMSVFKMGTKEKKSDIY